MRCESFWLGNELVWQIEPNFGAFCIKDRHLREEVSDMENSYYVDVVRQRDIDKICKIMWAKHPQKTVSISL